MASGISSAVRFAAWIAAMRAVPSTSPFPARPAAIVLRVAGSIRMRPAARAIRCVSCFTPDVDHVGRASRVEMGQFHV